MYGRDIKNDILGLVRLIFALVFALSMFLSPSLVYVAKADDVGINNPPELALDNMNLTIPEGQIASNSGTASDPDGDALTLSASFGSIIDHNDGTWSWSYTPEDGPADSQIVMINADDGNGGLTQATFDLAVDNVPPTALFENDGPVYEGQPFTLVLSNPTDPSTIDAHFGFEYAFDCGDGGGYGAFSTASTATCPTLYDGVRAVGGQIRDKDGGVREYAASVTVINSVPILAPLVLTSDLAQVGTTIQFTSVFTDPPYPNFDVLLWDWGDGSTDTVDQATSPTTIAHTYTEPGVYSIALTITDIDGDAVTGTYNYVVIYNPEGGFVTGGGWIDSPVGAYTPDPSLVGKATFGFVSKYKKGASTPTGNTEFQFQAGGINFRSTTYEWLVVNQNGTNAQFKGSGTINGALDPNGNEFKFMLWAGDDSPDTFRIRIWWDEAGGVEHEVYDNGFDQAIGGGSIVVHTGK